MSDIKTFLMNKSPFYDVNAKRDSNTTKVVTFRLPIEAYNKLMNYFEDIYVENAKTKGFNHLAYKQLEMICDERKTFNNLECFMLIPRVKALEGEDETDVYLKTLDVLNNYSEIIAIVNTDCDFIDDYNHSLEFHDEYNLVYQLNSFNDRDFPMSILRFTKDSCVYRTNKADLNSFYTFKDRQRELYHDNYNGNSLDVEDCYFVRFPLNNYLDEFRDGQYQDKSFENSHEGIFAFQELSSKLNLYCVINWDYSRENKCVVLEYYFMDREDFLKSIFETLDEKLIEASSNAVDDKHRYEVLHRYKDNLEFQLSLVNQIIENGFPDEDDID